MLGINDGAWFQLGVADAVLRLCCACVALQEAQQQASLS